MKNFLIALGLMIFIMFVKNLYEDNQFSKGEIERLNSELITNEIIIKKLQVEKKVLINKLQVEKKKNKIPKKVKKKITKPIELIPSVTPEIVPQQADSLINL